MSERNNDRAGAAALQELTALEIDYWYDVDFNWGRHASGFYTDGGLFAIGESRMQGTDAIRDFYAWREGRGTRTARHVVTNFRLDAFDNETATLRCILLLYAADGQPVLPSLPAILISDVIAECVRGPNGKFVFRSHVLSPVFMGGAAPTIKPS
ncbi:MAG: nuclear transport factor 2 family protein [Pseudomonadota bacterium]